MTNDELVRHLEGLGWTAESLQGQDGQSYIVIRDYSITSGSLADITCDVAVQRTPSIPYVAPPAIHTRPALVPMGTRNTQASGIGPEWQYWSRTVREQTPRGIVTHIATVFSEV
jgi:hypothetical protein